MKTLLLVAAFTCFGFHGQSQGLEPDDADASKAPPQAYLLPFDVQKIQDTSLTELLKLRPELKAEDLKVEGLTYMLRPEPDYAIQQQKDGTEKKLWLSSNYQELSVTYIILSTKRAGKEGERDTVIYDTASVYFPNARSNKFSVNKGRSTEYRSLQIRRDNKSIEAYP